MRTLFMTSRTGIIMVLATGLCLFGLARQAEAQCAFPHPKKAKKFQSDLVPAFVHCDPTGIVGLGATTTTEDFIPACASPTTFDLFNGRPFGNSYAWLWDPEKTTGQIQIKPIKTKPPSDPLSSGDLKIQLKLNNVLDGDSLPAGSVSPNRLPVADSATDDQRSGKRGHHTPLLFHSRRDRNVRRQGEAEDDMEHDGGRSGPQQSPRLLRCGASDALVGGRCTSIRPAVHHGLRSQRQSVCGSRPVRSGNRRRAVGPSPRSTVAPGI